MSAAIAEALLHFLWQGTVLGLLAYAFLRRAGSHAGARYALGIGTLTAMLLAPIVTTLWLLNESGGAAGAVVSGVDARRADVVPVEWVLGVWTCGVIACGIRLAGGWVVARRLATDAVSPVAREIDAMATAVAERLSVSRTFKVVESAIAATPMMVGWLKPVVLLPTAAIAGLSPRQLEAVIAHELAHIRRHDYLMNLLQSVVEALLFYHPAVWWVSRQVRDAREQCCDDLTVSVCDRLTYVSALSSVATLRAASPALAATGGSLRGRVERLLRPQPVATASVGWLAVIPIALVLISAAPVAVTPEAPVAPMSLATMEQPASVNLGATDQSSIQPIRSITNPQSSIPNPQFSQPSPTVLPALPVALDFLLPVTQAMTLQAPPPVQQAAAETYEVTVQGQVNAPGLHKLPASQMTVNRALLAARGFTRLAGQEIEIRRRDGVVYMVVMRTQLENGDDPALLPHDAILVKRSQIFFVNGEVNTAGQKLWMPGMTVGRAVAMSNGMTSAGGLGHIMRPQKADDGRVIRYMKIESLDLETPILPDDELVIARKVTELKPGAPVDITVRSAPELSGTYILQPDGSLRRKGQEPVATPARVPVLFFYVNGEVKAPGSYEWTEGMTVEKAIALAGGFLVTGKLSHIMRPVKDKDGKVIKYNKIKGLKNSTPILPGDELVTARKWFG